MEKQQGRQESISVPLETEEDTWLTRNSKSRIGRSPFPNLQSKEDVSHLEFWPKDWIGPQVRQKQATGLRNAFSKALRLTVGTADQQRGHQPAASRMCRPSALPETEELCVCILQDPRRI